MAHSISLQYMDAGWDEPKAGYEFTDQGFDVPADAHVPRVGEFIQLVKLESTKTYEVLAVNTRIVMLGDVPPNWHTYITVGPGDDAKDVRLTLIRE